MREHGIGWVTEAALTSTEIADEMLLMGLRIDEGVELARLKRLRGAPLNPQALAWLEEQGFVAATDGRIALTRAGRPLANKIAAELAI